MENNIYRITAGMGYESLVLVENELWLSIKKVRDIDKFEKAVRNTGMMKNAVAMPLANINEISFNESSLSTKIKYTDEKGKDKKIGINFSEKEISNQFGQHLGEKLGFNRSSSTENQVKPLLTNGLILLVTVATTIFLGTIDDTSEITNSTTGRNRGKGAFLKMIVDTIGQTGVLIIGGLISAYTAYNLYKRYKNPASEIIYTK